MLGRYKPAEPKVRQVVNHIKKTIKVIPEYTTDRHDSCERLQEHARVLRDDPERLSTKFICKLSGITCDEDEEDIPDDFVMEVHDDC